MIEEQVEVASIKGRTLWVMPLPGSGCARCDSGEGCGQGSSWLPESAPRGFPVDLPDDCERVFEPGDRVTLGFAEQSMLKAVFWLFVWPLLGLVGSASLLFYAGLGEPWVVAGSLGGLILAARLARRWGRLEGEAMQPQLLHRESVGHYGEVK